MLIGTHHGRFHADDVFAVAMLKHLYPDAKITRTRDVEILDTCSIVVDVGGGKFDHHTTEKIYRPNEIPYASAGLVWRHFGEEIIRKFTNEHDAQEIQAAIDEKLIQAIDAADNGVELEKDPRIKGISELIGGFNPPWNLNTDENDAFHTAVTFASKIIENQISREIARMEAVQIVKSAFTDRPSKEVLVLPHYCPWTETLLDLDEKNDVLYVTFKDNNGGYRIQTVPSRLGSFQSRKPLPETWAGKEYEELGRVVGVDDAVFCHPGRFIAGARSEESIRVMAKLAVEA